ncbi:MAG TPA: photosynthetic reaction center cytochrome c subunit family protein [Vicinamibacterales bacterium]|nr:photosynthetic reaction center cytochrome c subunit family protein [Vicinamibacterales bacterium]
MKVSRKVSLAAGALAALWVAGFVFAARPAAQEQPRMRESIVGKKAGVYFKNVSTSTLKELSVDDFIGAMGVMTDALGLDCADCHPNAGSDQVDWVFDTARKKTARRMVEMVANLNKEFFGGAQRVTCWTCHHGRVTPATSIQLTRLYEAPNDEVDDFVARDPEQPAATEILDKYIAATGGAQKWAGVRNYIASGSSIGFGGFGGDGQFEIFANNQPNQRTVRIQFPQHPDRGISTWVFNGTQGWINTPRALLENYDLIGGELNGAKLEAQIAFPSNIKNAMTNWRTGFRRVIGDSEYYTVQGNGPRGEYGTFYIDPKTYLLKRLVRYEPSPAGNILVEIDYDDWRDVNGVKLPFEYNFYWLDGRYTAKIKDYKFNTTLPAGIFDRPKNQ